MKRKKYLSLYKKWTATGRMNADGLCNSEIGKDELFQLFKPFESDDWRNGSFYWGNVDGWGFYFCSLRQNIVLLMAAMNGEL